MKRQLKTRSTLLQTIRSQTKTYLMLRNVSLTPLKMLTRKPKMLVKLKMSSIRLKTKKIPKKLKKKRLKKTLKRQRKLHQKKSKRKPKMSTRKKKLKPTKKLMSRIRLPKLVISLITLSVPKKSSTRLVQVLKRLIES